MMKAENQLKKIIQSYIVFTLSEKYFSINVSEVSTITEINDLSAITEKPLFLKGYSLYKDKVIPILDLQYKLFKKPSVITKNSSILILKLNYKLKPIQIGIIVDSIVDIRDYYDEDISPPIFREAFNINEYIDGYFETIEYKINILNISKVFSYFELLKLFEKAWLHIKEQ